MAHVSPAKHCGLAQDLPFGLKLPDLGLELLVSSSNTDSDDTAAPRGNPGPPLTATASQRATGLGRGFGRGEDY